MTNGWRDPSVARKVAFKASLYLVPSLKTCPTSMARRIFSGLAHFTQGSPALTVRKSNQAVTWISRSMETFFKWNPSSFAPVVISLAPCSRSSANTFRFAGIFATAPSEPGLAASSATISSTVAGRTAAAPVLAANFVSFN